MADDISRFYENILNPGGGLFAPPPTVSPASTQYFPADGSYGYNSSTGAYEPRQAGNAYTVGPLKPNTDFTLPAAPNPAVAAIQQATAPLPSAPAVLPPLPNVSPTTARPTVAQLPALPTQNVTAQLQPRNLLDLLFSGKDGGFQRPSLLNVLSNGLTAMQMAPPQMPRAPLAPLTPIQAANQNPAALAALNRGQTSYANNGALLPTVTMNGQVRNSYGDSSSYGSGGSLV